LPNRAAQNRFWILALVALVVALWALKPMLLPFVAAFTIAYFLNPVVNKLSTLKFPRGLGALAVLLGFVALVTLLLLLIVPLLQNQLGALIAALPEYIATAREHVMPRIEHWLALLSSDDVDKLRDAAGQYAGTAVSWAGTFLQGVIKESFALFDILKFVVITPLVAFYLLRDWPRLTSAVDAFLPRKHHQQIRSQLKEIDRTLSGFIRGQALVCLCLGLIYSIGLTLVGLKYGATIGIVAGILSFIPYVGSTFCGVSSLVLALAQFDSWTRIGLVVLVFLVGQSLEGYVLTPKLVGGRVGLHPVWILFALFAGGSLLGFVGVLIAVPVAAVTGVLFRAALRRYKASAIYQ